MPEQANARNLPPIARRALPKDQPDNDVAIPKVRKKKITGSHSDTEAPRGRSRGPSVTLTESDDHPDEGKTHTRRKTKPLINNGNLQSNGYGDTPDDESIRYPASLNSSTISKTRHKKKEIGTSRETLTGQPEGENITRKKKKKKKKIPRDTVDDGGEILDYDLGLAAELTQIKDDVVNLDEDGDDYESVQVAAPAMRSEPLGTVFIERKNGFKAEDKVKLARRMEEAQQQMRQLPQEPPSHTTMQFGLSTQRHFKTFTLFCHGIFAGFAFWHIVMVFTLNDIIGMQGFLGYYYKLAQPVQSLYFIFFVLCTVSTFDRYDLNSVNRRFVIRSLTLQNGAVSCFFYLFGLIVSLAIAATDDKISLFRKSPLLWQNNPVAEAELKTWKILNVVRGVMSILGWYIISLRPNTDRLTKNLQKADENAIGDELTLAETSALPDHTIDIGRVG